MLTLSENEMRQAVTQRDAAFDGRFYYAVITTGVCCNPSCTSKAANAQNIRFFTTCDDAIKAGFRPCKRCHPEGKSPAQTLLKVARYIEAHSEDKLTLATLSEVAELSSSRLQRAFKARFGVSPKQYQDTLRMQKFKCALQQGDEVTEAIYASGFGSISRVYGQQSRKFGMTPKAYRAGGQGEQIHYACRASTLGYIIMAATEKGVCSVQLGDDEASLVTLIAAEFPKATLILSQAQNAPLLDNWIDALEAHLSHGAPQPDVPLDIRGSAFQTLVWQFLMTIKEGEVMSYGEVAEKINKPKAVRAVGTACGKNAIGILIPCHRVLRSDGTLGGYRWGLARKKALLAQEQKADD